MAFKPILNGQKININENENQEPIVEQPKEEINHKSNIFKILLTNSQNKLDKEDCKNLTLLLEKYLVKYYN